MVALLVEDRVEGGGLGGATACAMVLALSKADQRQEWTAKWTKTLKRQLPAIKSLVTVNLIIVKIEHVLGDKETCIGHECYHLVT
jgi:hypothetical protein